MRLSASVRRAPAAGRGAARLGGAVRALAAVVLVLAGPQARGELGAAAADAYRDAFTTPAAAVSRLHAAHRKVIC